MLKRMTHIGHFDEARCSRPILVHVLRDQFVIFAAHDPIVLAVQNQSWNFHPRPCAGEIQILQLLIKRKWSAVEVIVIGPFRPDLGELRLPFENLINAAAFDQPILDRALSAFEKVRRKMGS